MTMTARTKAARDPLGLDIPLVAAPMAGGATTVAMVIAAAEAGGLGFLAAGYKTPQVLLAEIAAVRKASIPFGVNIFAPNPVPIDAVSYRQYAYLVQQVADRFELELPPDPIEDDDAFGAKIDLLLTDPVPVVSFTFGLPGGDVIARLQKVGTIVVQTVTSSVEATAAAAAGADLVVAQAGAAGGHSGTFTPDRPPAGIAVTDLVAEVSATVDIPVIAAGGLASAEEVSQVLGAGAVAAAVGTALLRADESAASPTHKAALLDPVRKDTVLTRAFTGRPARGLRNAFIDRFEADAPLGYPAIHHLTSALRKAAAAAGVDDLVHLWAGTGYRRVRDESTATILAGLARNG
ncbi:nitronate monooxygenase [Mycolicibacterium neoaurum]|uniref:nitronate monooxygenase n=1 Tax=Mycolicibacterium neoaurum TaxID=1795 RepID=UPI002672B025|nr:nitronate monooxygenase [Mycolicibacterium neoaurum]MDO3399131.1 nitronate monooxygenase [Mycolicibacterium neoaurum]